MPTTRINIHGCFTLIIVALLNFGAFAQATRIPAFSNWYQQYSVDEGFSAAFPSKPVLRVEDQNFPNFNTKFHRYMETSHKGYSFEVGHAVYPPSINDKKIIFDTLETLLSSKFSKLHAHLDSRKEIMSGNCSGEEMHVTASNGTWLKIRFFMSGQHLYQLTAGSDLPERSSSGIIDHFLDSFTVIGGCNDRIATYAAPSGEIKTSVIDGTLDSATGWRKIVSDRDGLEMLLPNSAKVDEEDVSVEPLLTSRTFLSVSGTATYYVNVTGDFPPGLMKPSEAQTRLELQEKNLATKLQSIHPKISLLRNLKIGIYSGREYAIVTDGERVGRAQVILTAKKVFWILVSDGKDNYSQAAVDRFLGSIRISIN